MRFGGSLAGKYEGICSQVCECRSIDIAEAGFAFPTLTQIRAFQVFIPNVSDVTGYSNFHLMRGSGGIVAIVRRTSS